ncbi:MAG: S9 family peptidase [Anaerolineae bacterium]|nr:S9 family peptidase [Phycisphaerae bacterium]
MKHASLVFVSTLLIGLAGCATSQEDGNAAQASDKKSDSSALIPRDVLFGNPDKAQARLSYDGKHISFTAPVDGVMNVWVGPANDLSAAKPVTHDKKRGIRQYQWAYNNEQILYLQDEGGNENWNVHVVDVNGKDDKNLTPNPKVTARINQLSEKFPDEVIIGMNDRNPMYHDLHRVNIRTGKDTLVFQNPQQIEGNNVAGQAVDDDFNVRFVQAVSPTGGGFVFTPSAPVSLAKVTEPVKEQSWKEFAQIPMEDALTTGLVGFDASGDVLYFQDSRDRDTSALYAWNLKTNDKKLIAENNKADFSGALVDPKTKAVQAASFNYERVQWQVLDPAIKGDLDYLKTVADGDVSVTSRTLDDKWWTVAYLLDNGPARTYLYDRDKKKANFLFVNKKDLEGLKLAKMHPVVVPARDGLNLVCYVTTPLSADPDQDGKVDRPVPMILDVHGGPWARDSWGYNPEHQWLANRGYAVMSVNYRGSTGFGKKFGNAAVKEWAGKMHDDLIDAVNYAVKNKIARPDKVAIMGGSYGGYATLVGLTFTPDVFACGVDIVGPSNLYTLLKSVPPYWKPAVAQWRNRVGDETTSEGKAFLESRSPLTHVDKITKPLLIGQGANDPRVKQAEADQIVAAMNEKKIPVTYVLYPDEGHGFARPENRLSFFGVTEAFLAQHLGGKFEPIGDDFKNSSIQVKNGADQVPGLKDAMTPTAKSE